MSQSNSEEMDIFTKFISSTVSVILTECSSAGALSADEITKKIVQECTFDPEYIDPERLTPLQKHKISLMTLYDDIVDDITHTVKWAIKDELRMEMFIELQKLNDDMKVQTAQPTVESVAGSIPKFSVTFGKGGALSDILGGYDSLAETTTFGENRAKKTEKDLSEDPLFARINKNLERAKTGQAMYTVDEIINSRAARFDKETLEELEKRKSAHGMYQVRAMKHKQSYEEDEDETKENERWDKLFNAKFNIDK